VPECAHLFTDADNIWDTDAVFADAQLEMLRDVEKMTGQYAPDAGDRGLAFLRNIDQRIAATHPDHLRYPPALLAYSLALVLEGDDSEHVITRAIELDTSQLVHFADVQSRYLQGLKQVPGLREGVREGIVAVSDVGIPITVVTEERLERCLRLLEFHSLDRMIRHVASVKKSPHAFITLKQQVNARRVFMVGDQLDRDIHGCACRF
jgi:putative hydrolase of the HAD superfamily